MSDKPRSAAAGQKRPELALTSDDIYGLAGIAGRAPSLHNTQPWKFSFLSDCIDLYADKSRMLRKIDPAGREMLISCGAALFGLRLGLRKLGFVPDVQVLPDPARQDLIGRLRLLGVAPATSQEAELLAAVPHRHTHRGPFAPGDVSPRLLCDLQLDAVAEQAELVIVEQAGQVRELAGLVVAAAAEQEADPEIVAELQAWVRQAGASARDGVPAAARVGATTHRSYQTAEHGGPRLRATPVSPRLPQRNFGLPGTESPEGHPPSVTAVLATPGDTPADWIHAGQALHRLLLHAATRWVFASLQSQPLESPPLRAEVRACLGLSGYPQLLLQFGRANSAAATVRRQAHETTRG